MSTPLIGRLGIISKQDIVLLSVAILSIQFAGCNSHKSDIERRVKNTRDVMTRNIRGDSDRGASMRAAAISAINRTDAASLGKPILVWAGTQEVGGDRLGIQVVWLEDYPSPDGVRVSVPKRNWSILIALDPVGRSESEKMAMSGVLYDEIAVIDAGGDQAALIAKQATGEEVSVELTLRKEIVSNSINLWQP